MKVSNWQNCQKLHIEIELISVLSTTDIKIEQCSPSTFIRLIS